MSSERQQKRKGTWDLVKQFQDPDSNITVVVSERIRGKHAYSIQLGHVDDLGFNKHIPVPAPGAKHDLKHIVYSLVEAAEKLIAEREKKG